MGYGHYDGFLSPSRKGHWMAKNVVLVDDLDGGAADESVTFGIDGTEYEIDLSNANAKKLRKVLAPYVEAGRKTSTDRQHRGASVRKQALVGAPAAEVRAWAKTAGLEVPDFGRIPAEVRVKFLEAHA